MGFCAEFITNESEEGIVSAAACACHRISKFLCLNEKKRGRTLNESTNERTNEENSGESCCLLFIASAK